MANDVIFEGKERRIAKIEQCLAEYGGPYRKRKQEKCAWKKALTLMRL